jgi:hypothetical protein
MPEPAEASSAIAPAGAPPVKKKAAAWAALGDGSTRGDYFRTPASL